MGEVTLERTEADSAGDTGIGEIIGAMQDTSETYRDSWLKTAHCLNVANTALEYAIAELQKGNVGTMCLARLRKDQAYIKGLMV